ncbi:MAG: hypothetical protein Kow00117_05050 [Phototrophicales bacterium]
MTTMQFNFRDYRSMYDNTPVFYPGDRVAGQVVIVPDKTVNCRNIRVDVGWYTQGKGDRDREIIYQYIIDVQRLDPGIPISQQFAVDIPAMPYTFSGHLINIIWAVQVTVDIAMRGDINGAGLFIVRPPQKRGID